MGKPIEILISPKGVARHIYSEEASAITAGLGEQTIRRASHVDVTQDLTKDALNWLLEQWRARANGDWAFEAIPNNKWWADLKPSGGGVLGPFDTRQQALDAETEWLRAHSIPTCPDGNCSTSSNTSDPLQNIPVADQPGS